MNIETTKTCTFNWSDVAILAKDKLGNPILTIYQLDGGDEAARQSVHVQLRGTHVIQLRDFLLKYFPPQGGEQEKQNINQN